MKRLAPAALADPSWPAPLDTVGITAAAQLSHGSNPPAPRTTGKVRVEGALGQREPSGTCWLGPSPARSPGGHYLLWASVSSSVKWVDNGSYPQQQRGGPTELKSTRPGWTLPLTLGTGARRPFRLPAFHPGANSRRSFPWISQEGHGELAEKGFLSSQQGWAEKPEGRPGTVADSGSAQE